MKEHRTHYLVRGRALCGASFFKVWHASARRSDVDCSRCLALTEAAPAPRAKKAEPVGSNEEEEE